MQSCCSPRDCIDPFQLLLSSRPASASAAARRLCPLQLLLSIASASTLLPDGVRFVCCSPMASALSAAPRLRPLQLCSPMTAASSAAPQLHPLQLLLPDCVRFGCCSPPAVLEDSGHVRYVHYSRTFYNYTQSLRFKYEGRASL